MNATTGHVCELCNIYGLRLRDWNDATGDYHPPFWCPCPRGQAAQRDHHQPKPRMEKP